MAMPDPNQQERRRDATRRLKQATRRIRQATRRLQSSQRDPVARKRLLELVGQLLTVAEDALSVVLFVPPRISLPIDLVQEALAGLGVIHGIDRPVLSQAARPSAHERELVVARAPEHLAGGKRRDIFENTVRIAGGRLRLEVADDRMTVWLIGPAGSRPSPESIRTLLLRHGLRTGFERATIAEILREGLPAGERVVIARGESPVADEPEGFRLRPEAGADGKPRRVAEGAVLADWHPGRQGRSGHDVYGSPCAAPRKPPPLADNCVGPGTELQGNAPRWRLVATTGGLCYQRPDGRVLVMDALEVPGGLSPDDGPLTTPGTVVIDGDVADGARLTAGGDVIVTGNLGDAAVRVGGHLEVQGVVEAGNQEVSVGGILACTRAHGRRLVARDLRCCGTVTDCRITCEDDLDIDHAVGGELNAGGSLHLRRAGDRSGKTTRLCAGRHLDLAEQAARHKLRLAGTVRERQLAQEDLRDVAHRLDTLRGSLKRLDQADYVDSRQARAMHQRAQHLVARAHLLGSDIERLRGEIAERRNDGQRAAIAQTGDPERVRIDVDEAARRGVATKFADLPTDRLAKTRHHFHRSLPQAVDEHQARLDTERLGRGAGATPGPGPSPDGPPGPGPTLGREGSG